MSAPFAALAALLACLTTPLEMHGQDWAELSPHITINGQVALGISAQLAQVQCVLCNTQTCSPEMPESSLVYYEVVHEPLGWGQGNILNLDTGAHVGEPWTYDFQIPMSIPTENLASSIQSYACRLLIGNYPVGPGAPDYRSRPREGTPFTGLVTGPIP